MSFTHDPGTPVIAMLAPGYFFEERSLIQKQNIVLDSPLYSLSGGSASRPRGGVIPT
jgi:hypothetical protein